MTFDTIMTAISQVGFPIAIALLLLYYMQKINQQHHDDLVSMEERHKEEILSLKSSIDANTQAMTRFIEKGERHE